MQAASQLWRIKNPQCGKSSTLAPLPPSSLVPRGEDPVLHSYRLPFEPLLLRARIPCESSETRPRLLHRQERCVPGCVLFRDLICSVELLEDPAGEVKHRDDETGPRLLRSRDAVV